MRTSGGQTILQGLCGKGRGDVHPGDCSIHARYPKPSTLSDVLIRELCAHSRSREVPGAAGTAISAGRDRSGFSSTGNGYPGFSSWQRQVLGHGPRDLRHESFVRGLLFTGTHRKPLRPIGNLFQVSLPLLYVPKFGILLIAVCLSPLR